MPKIGDEFDLTVSYAVSPDNFVITTRNTGGRYCYWMIHGPYNSSLFVSLGDAFDHLASSMSEFYSSSEKCSPYSVCSSDKAMSKYAAAKLNDRDWQRYSDTLEVFMTSFQLQFSGLKFCKLSQMGNQHWLL